MEKKRVKLVIANEIEIAGTPRVYFFKTEHNRASKNPLEIVVEKFLKIISNGIWPNTCVKYERWYGIITEEDFENIRAYNIFEEQ